MWANRSQKFVWANFVHGGRQSSVNERTKTLNALNTYVLWFGFICLGIFYSFSLGFE